MTAPPVASPGIPSDSPPFILPNAPPDILLFRHAATDMGDGPRRYIGRTEVPLSREGRVQAAAWWTRLAGLNVVGAYASPSERARETARLMLGLGGAPDAAGNCDGERDCSPRASDTPDTPGAPGTSGVPGGFAAPGEFCVRGDSAATRLTILADLAEMDLGEWEGLVQARVRETRPDAYARRGREPWTFRPPGGECCADVAARGLRALAAMWQDWTAGRGGKAGTMPCTGGAACAEGQNPAAGQLYSPGRLAGGGHAPFIVAVSHAGLIRSVLCALGHMGQDALLTLPVRHLHCVRLRRHDPRGGGVPGVASAPATAPATTAASPTLSTSPMAGATAVWRVVTPDWQP